MSETALLALVEVVKKRLKTVSQGGSHRIEFPGPEIKNEINLKPIADALESLPRVELAPLVEAILKMTDQLLSRPQPLTEVKVDMSSVASAINKFAKVMDSYDETMDQHNKLLEKLVKVLANAKPATVINPKIKKSTTKVTRNKDGEMKETETTYEYEK